MGVTITVHEPLASQLEAQAVAQRLPLEEYALRVLGEAASEVPDPDWQVSNQRRVALIRKRFAGGLNQEETDELQRLQRVADQKLDALDKERLHDVRRLRDLAEQIVSRPVS